MLILTSYIQKHELKPLKKYFSLNDIVKGAEKVAKGLGQNVSFAGIGDIEFFKVRIGSAVKGRMR